MTAPALLTMAQLVGFADQFAATTPGVRSVALLSTDGLLLAGAGMRPQEADLMAATTGGLIALAFGGSVHFDLGDTTHVLIAYSGGNLLVCAVNDRCVLTVLTEPETPTADVLYEMQRFGEAHGDAISPSVRPTLTAPVRA